MRLVKRPKATAVDVIHYHDMQEALESSQSILETGPYAVELTDKMILDLARGNIEQSQRMGFVQGDPAAILIVEYAGDTRGGQEQGRGTRGAPRRGRLRLCRARRPRSGRAAVDLEAPQGRARAPPRHQGRGQAHRLHRGHGGRSQAPARLRPRFRDIMAKHGAEGAYYGHCSVGCLHIRPSSISRRPADSSRFAAWPRRSSTSCSSSRRHLQRARRRARAQPLPRARLRPGAHAGFREFKAPSTPRT